MLDFTSSLYLGLRHSSSRLRPWAQMTPGVPAALASPAVARVLAGELAALTGTERATLARSTLHAFWDLFGILSAETGAIYVDAGAYPIARWGIERAAARGVPVQTFSHRDPVDLRRRLRRRPRPELPPVIVADGVCPTCGRVVPTGEYLDSVRPLGGRLVLDDTQALGILGDSPSPGVPYGHGGGGSLRWSAIGGPDIVLVSSLAKGFGAPLAMVAGGAAEVERFEAESETRVHCSPPSMADLHAAERALRVNQTRGEARRFRLAALVRRLREGLRRLRLAADGSLFPVQSLAPVHGLGAPALHELLMRSGIRSVLHRPPCRPDATVSLLVTAAHTPRAIDRVLAALAGGLAPGVGTVPVSQNAT